MIFEDYFEINKNLYWNTCINLTTQSAASDSPHTPELSIMLTFDLLCIPSLIKMQTVSIVFTRLLLYKSIEILTFELWSPKSKVNRVHPLNIVNIYASSVSFVFTRLLQYKSIVTLTFKINRVHPLYMSAKFGKDAHNGSDAIVFTGLFQYSIYCQWLNFHEVPIFVVFVEGPIHKKFQYPRIGNFLYELWRKILWPRILNPIIFNPWKLIPMKIKPSTVYPLWPWSLKSIEIILSPWLTHLQSLTKMHTMVQFLLSVTDWHSNRRSHNSVTISPLQRVAWG